MLTGKNDRTVLGPGNRCRLSLRQIEVFVALARAGNTRAAADRIARSQSAASSALMELEAVLGAQVFDRVGRRLILNEGGRNLLPRALELLDRANSIETLFARNHEAPLAVAASFTIGEYLLPTRVSDWTRAHPRSRIDLHISNTRDVIDRVAAFDVDVGFIEGPQTHPDLIVRRWLADELIIFAAPGHPFAKRRPTTGQLADVAWVLREQGSGTRQMADAWLTRHLREVSVGLELASTEAIKQVVGSGYGLGCLSRHAVEQSIEDGRLVEITTRLPKATRVLAAVIHKEKLPGRVMNSFLEHCGVGARDPQEPG